MKKFNLENKELEKFIEQLIRYNISKKFGSVESIKEWLNTLNEKQILI